MRPDREEASVDPNWTFRWKNAQACIPDEKVEAAEIEFRLGFLGAALESRPCDRDLLSELGEILTRQGRVEEGLEVDLKLARLYPEDPTVHYNLACSLALTGQAERAIKSLRKAILKGFSDFGLLAKDPDIESLREHPEFLALFEKARKAT
jgi:predicted Zn-dependent protease